MIVHLITALAVTAIVILLCWAFFRTLKKPMPRSLIPILGGLTVIAYGIYSEYSWQARTMAQMPDSVAQIHQVAGTSAFSPWAYLIPRIDRMSVVDTNALRRNPEHPDYVMLDLLFMQRFSPVIQVRQLVDCRQSRRADLTTEPVFDSQGLPENLQWEALPAGHRLQAVACDAP